MNAINNLTTTDEHGKSVPVAGIRGRIKGIRKKAEEAEEEE